MTAKPFVYGMSVEGDNFTDREKETRRLCQDFENGVNVILISPRRMGKTSLVKRVKGLVSERGVCVVMMDIYDCRTEYEFYNRFATAVLRQTATRLEQMLDSIGRFLSRVTPKVSFRPDLSSEFSVSLGLSPDNYQPEEILSLPERIAAERGRHIVVCVDEFQQIGEMPGSMEIQKRLRGVWQHQSHVSYCLFGSKRHLMENLFQNREMPFYQFGEMQELKPIPLECWVPFIESRFRSKGLSISAERATRICELVGCHSSYVQQLAWNVMAETEQSVEDAQIELGWEALLAQCGSYFREQIKGLTTFQMNFLRLMSCGVTENFAGKAARTLYEVGTKSNLPRIVTTLTGREIVETDATGRIRFTDEVFAKWFRRECM